MYYIASYWPLSRILPPPEPKTSRRFWAVWVGLKVDNSWFNKVISELNRKAMEDVMAQGIGKLASIPSERTVAVSATPSPKIPAAGSAPTAAQKKKDEKQSDSMRFGLLIRVSFPYN